MKYTVLVNEEHPLKESFKSRLELICYQNFLIEKETLNHYKNLLIEQPSIEIINLRPFGIHQTNVPLISI